MSDCAVHEDNCVETETKKLVSSIIPNVAISARLSREFPSSSSPAFTYYNDFPQYKSVMSGNSRKILSLIQQMIDNVHGEASILDVPRPKSLMEKFKTIVDVNDKVLDRVTMILDCEDRDHTKETFNQQIIVASSNNTNLPCSDKYSGKNDSNNNQSEAPHSEVKLISSKYIKRPQAFFSSPPDNTHSYFRPIIKKKPNAITELEDYTKEGDLENEDYIHPYTVELENFGSDINQFDYQLTDNPQPNLLNNTSLYFIDSIDALERMMGDLRLRDEIAVDLEHHNFRTYLGLTCLIQISTRSTDYIVDALALRDNLSCLNEVFTNPMIVKVLHGSDWDLMWLQRDFGVYIVNLFDTGLAARSLQLPRFSLSYLLQSYANITTNKAYQLADWRIRPLPTELVEYARTDTHYLLYIAERLRSDLNDKGLLHSVLHRSHQLCYRIYKKPQFDPMGYQEMYRQSIGDSFTRRQLFALKHLYSLRDSIARREDESIQYVMPNHMMKVLAQELPREANGIFSCCSPTPPLVRKYVYDLHKIISDARNNKIKDLAIEDLDNVASEEVADQPLITLPTQGPGVFEWVTVAAPPHDFTPRGPFQPLQISDQKLFTVRYPSVLGTAFQTINSQSAFKNDTKFSSLEPNRAILQKVLDSFKNLPTVLITSVVSDKCDNDGSHPIDSTDDFSSLPIDIVQQKPPSPDEVIHVSKSGVSTDLEISLQQNSFRGRKNKHHIGKSLSLRVQGTKKFAIKKQQENLAKANLSQTMLVHEAFIDKAGVVESSKDDIDDSQVLILRNEKHRQWPQTNSKKKRLWDWKQKRGAKLLDVASKLSTRSNLPSTSKSATTVNSLTIGSSSSSGKRGRFRGGRVFQKSKKNQMSDLNSTIMN